MPLPQLQTFQGTSPANSAIKAMTLGNLIQGRKDAQAPAPVNAAAVNLEELKEKKRVSARAERLEVSEFALQVLSGVNSAEDWDRAKEIMVSRFPQHSEGIMNQGEYDPQMIRMIQNALRDETQKLKSEELGLKEDELDIRSDEQGTDQYEAETGRMGAEDARKKVPAEKRKLNAEARKIGADVRKITADIAQKKADLAEKKAARESADVIKEAELILADREADLEDRKFDAEENEKELKGFAPGTAVYEDGKRVEQVPFKPEGFEIFENEAKEQIWVQEGKTIPKGYRKVEKAASTQVTVNTGDDLSGAVTTQLQKDIIQGAQSVRSFNETGKLFKPEYLTYWGKGEKIVAGAMDKMGLSSEGEKTLIRERNAWFTRAKRDFIAYRKWATGVAGGEKEMAEIATAFPDPVKNGPTEYVANLKGIEETTKAVLSLNQDFLALNVDMTMPIEDILRIAEGAGIPMPPGSKTGVKRIKFNKNGEKI
jgi:hypothetical protein